MAKVSVPFFYMFMMASFRTLRHSYELFKNHQSQLLALELKRLKKEIEADESEEFGGYLKQSVEREFANDFPRLQSYYAIVLLYSNVEYWLRASLQAAKRGWKVAPGALRFPRNARGEVHTLFESVKKADFSTSRLWLSEGG